MPSDKLQAHMITTLVNIVGTEGVAPSRPRKSEKENNFSIRNIVGCSYCKSDNFFVKTGTFLVNAQRTVLTCFLEYAILFTYLCILFYLLIYLFIIKSYTTFLK